MTEVHQPPDPVWEATVDEHTWKASVVRLSVGEGMLTVSRIADGKVVLEESVGLMFDALFGPDVDDVNLWQTMTIEAIDHYTAQNGRKEHD